MVKEGIIRLSLLAGLIALLNGLYNATLYQQDLEENSPEYVKILKTRDSTDLYYFGESSNITYAPDDSIKSSISELTQQKLGSYRITNINKYATHLGMYKEWMKHVRSDNNNGPIGIILTLNLRSFDAAWIHSKLETPLRESLVMMEPWPNMINRFLLSLQAFDNKTETQREQDMLNDWSMTPLGLPYPFKYRTVREWDDAMAAGGHLQADGTWNTPKIELSCHYIKAYAFTIRESNPRIRDLDEIQSWCSQNNVKLFLNLMAENVEYADSLVGKDLVFLMKRNRDYLIRRYQNSNCVVIDNLECVKGKDFIDQNWTTEHYTFNGRNRIAENLSQAIKENLKRK